MAPRAERVARARVLRDQERVLREIAEEMGVAISTVHDWLRDPDGSKLKARKLRYVGECIDCGAPTGGSEGRGPNAPKRCRRCAGRRNREREQERNRERRELVERLWAEGKSFREIGEALGWKGSPWNNICQLRNRGGYHLPHRRPPREQSAGM
jgi:transcriptional regulator with XRE-family HTH domain